ncbi:MAG: hypothetical protein EOP48_18585 [Sphingobacteriales bacterium]|nr:MAG: hypothetical protein EOP48_18585 [Sphingobacteriales bacterium]
MKSGLRLFGTLLSSNKFKSGKHVIAPESKFVYFHNPSAKITKNLGKHEFQLSYNYNRSGEDKTQDQKEYGALETSEPVLNKVPKMQRVDDRITLNTHLPSFYWSSSVLKSSVLKVGYQGFYTSRDIVRNTEAYDEKTNAFTINGESVMIAVADASNKNQWEFVNYENQEMFNMVFNENIKKELGL